MRGKLQMIYYLKIFFGHFYVPFGFRHYLGVFVSKVIKHDVYNSPYISYPP